MAEHNGTNNPEQHRIEEPKVETTGNVEENKETPPKADVEQSDESLKSTAPESDVVSSGEPSKKIFIKLLAQPSSISAQQTVLKSEDGLSDQSVPEVHSEPVPQPSDTLLMVKQSICDFLFVKKERAIARATWFLMLMTAALTYVTWSLNDTTHLMDVHASADASNMLVQHTLDTDRYLSEQWESTFNPDTRFRLHRVLVALSDVNKSAVKDQKKDLECLTESLNHCGADENTRLDATFLYPHYTNSKSVRAFELIRILASDTLAQHASVVWAHPELRRMIVEDYQAKGLQNVNLIHFRPEDPLGQPNIPTGEWTDYGFISGAGDLLGYGIQDGSCEDA